MNAPDTAVEALYESMAAYVQRRVPDPADASDVLHDVFERLLTRDGPDDPAKLELWAKAIARNAVIDHYRSRRRATVRTERLTRTAVEPEPEPIDGADETLDLTRTLRALLETLSPQDRDVLERVDGQGLSQRDYAEQEGIEYSAAKSRVQRARRRLHAEFRRCCRFTLDGRGRAVDCERRRKDEDCC